MSGNSFRDTESQSVTIYSIGHSNQPMEAFLELLNRHGIQTLIDIRSHPYSRYVPHFNGPELANAAGHVKLNTSSWEKNWVDGRMARSSTTLRTM